MAHFHSNALIGASGQGGAEANIERSVRLNSADSAHLTRTPSSSGNRKTWTWSGWVKRSSVATSDQGIFGSTNGATFLRFKSNQLDFVVNGSTHKRTSQVFRDNSGWYHFVWAVDTTQATASNRSRFYVNGVEVTDWGTDNALTQNTDTGVNNAQTHVIGATDVVPNDKLDAYLTDFYLIDGSQLQPTSFGAFDGSGVWQAAAFSGAYGTNGFHLFDFASESTVGHDSSGNENDFTAININATAPTNSGPFSAANAYTGTTGNSYGSADGSWNSAFDGSIHNGVTVNNASGETILTMVNSATWSSQIRIRRQYQLGQVDGWVKLNTTEISGGTSSSQWIDVTSTMGSSGTLTSVGIRNYARLFAIELDGVILKDSASAAQQDVLHDVPLNGDASNDTGAGGELSSNYPTMNPLAKNSNTTLSNGNLDVSSTAVYTTVSTIAFPSTGKYYAEFRINGTASGYPFVGIGGFNDTGIDSNANPNTGAFYAQGGYVTGSVSVSSLTALSAGDIVGMAYDTSNGKVWFSINGTYVSSGDPANGTNATCTISANASGYSLATSTYQDGTVSLNAGQRAFNTNAPSGFKCLCTSNLPTATIADGSTAMSATLWTGNGSTQTISGLNHSPDFIWHKIRSISGGSQLYDSVRGTSNRLRSDSTAAESTLNGVTAFNSDGWTMTAGNNNNETYVSWTWDAGSSTVSNTDGSITSSVRANQSAGFSIVTYTGVAPTVATVGHGLNAAPDLIIIKVRDRTGEWPVFHSALDISKTLYLESTAAQSGGHWNSTAPTSSVFTVGNSSYVNGSGDPYVAYCFAPVAGYSAIGKFDSTNTTDNAFVYTGFRPRFLLWKKVDDTGSWGIYDAARNPFNAVDKVLLADSANAESTLSTPPLDFLSNGFKVRDTLGTTNDLIYMCFAENPFQANGGLAR